MTERRRRGEGVPPLRNEDVTGVTEPKQHAIIRESGQLDQAQHTKGR